MSNNETTDDGDDRTEYKTMRVPKPDWEKARKQKQEAGRTWGEQIVRPGEDGGDAGDDVAGELEALREEVERVPGRTADELEGGFR